LLAAACSDSSTSPRLHRVSSDTFSVLPGGVLWLGAQARADLGGRLGAPGADSSSRITFVSSDPSIATVDTGVVVGLAAGTTTVTATLSGHSVAYRVNVRLVTFAAIYAGNGICGITTESDVICSGWDPWPLGVQTDMEPDCERAGCYWYYGEGVVRLAFARTNHVALRALSLGAFSSCGLDATGAAYCWGDPQTGLMQAAALSTPCDTLTGNCTPGFTRVNTSVRFKELHAGYNAACGVGLDAAAYCWGTQQYGELDGTSASSLSAATRVPIPSPVTSIAMGSATCAVSNQRVWCAGDKRFFGNDTANDRAIGLGIGAGGAAVIAVAGSSCALTTDGRALCWSFRTPAVEPAPGHAFVAVDAAVVMGCGLEAAGDVYCWGNNGFGELGSGTITPGDTTGLTTGAARLVAGGHKFRSISVGGGTACAMENAIAYCWGVFAVDGQFPSSHSVPVRLPGQR
jgi:hypothetical protein